MAGNLPDLVDGVGDFLRDAFRQSKRSPVGRALGRVVDQAPATVLLNLHASASDAAADLAFGGGYDRASDEADAACALVEKGEVLPVESRHFHSVVVYERDSNTIRQRDGVGCLVKTACGSRVTSADVRRCDGHGVVFGRLNGASSVFLKCQLQPVAITSKGRKHGRLIGREDDCSGILLAIEDLNKTAAGQGMEPQPVDDLIAAGLDLDGSSRRPRRCRFLGVYGHNGDERQKDRYDTRRDALHTDVC